MTFSGSVSLFLFSAYFFTASAVDLLAKLPPPPPPGVTTYGVRFGAVHIPEDKWKGGTDVEVVGTVKLTGDREVRGIWMNEENSPSLNLNGHLLTVSDGGINAYYNEHRPYIRGGEITSSRSFLTIKTGTSGSSQVDYQGNKIIQRLGLYSVIRDHNDHQVGLLITGSHPVGESGQVNLMGNQANTFTGDVIVEGARNSLHLNKSDGVTSIRGNVFVRKRASVNIVGSDQIADSSTVTLSGRSTLSFSSTLKVIREKIHALVVKEGTNRLVFYHPEEIRDDFKKTLILDDLIISDDAFLRISGWEAGRDHLLVRKDSEHLAGAFKKITIDGWGKNQVYLKDHNKEYWSIEAAPEPSTYGAILGTVGLGLFIYRRHRQSWGGLD